MKIERKWLIRLLYRPIDEVKKISQEQLDKVIERYPLIGEVHNFQGDAVPQKARGSGEMDGRCRKAKDRED